MTISLRAVGASTAAAAAVTPLAPGVPAGLTATDLSILIVEVKGLTAGTAPTITAGAGWSAVGPVTNNGTIVAGTDTGSNTIGMFYRTGTYSTPSVVTTGGDSAAAVIVAYQTTLTGWDVTATATGIDTTSGANGSINGTVNINATTGDWVVVGAAMSGDVGSVTAETLAATGATFGTLANRLSLGVTTGTDSRLQVSDWPVTGGPSSAIPVYTWTNASSTTGHARFLRIREVTLDAEVWDTSVTDRVASMTGVVARFRAADLDSTRGGSLSNGNAVASWTSKNGVTAMGGSNGIIYVKASLINDRPAVRFDGVSGRCHIQSSVPTGTIAAERTVAMVVATNSTTVVQQIVYVGGYSHAFIASAQFQQFATATLIGGAVSAGVANVWSATGSAAGNEFTFKDGTQVATGQAGAPPTSSAAFEVGATGFNSNWFNGDIAELVSWDHVLTATELSTWHSYVQDTYGITVSDFVGVLTIEKKPPDNRARYRASLW